MEERARLLERTFTDSRLRKMVLKSAVMTETRQVEYGFEVYHDYYSGRTAYTGLVIGEYSKCPLDEARVRAKPQGTLLLSVHTHTHQPGESDREVFARSEHAGDASGGDLMCLVNDYKDFRAACAEELGITGDEEHVNQMISPIGMVVYPLWTRVLLHTYQLTGHIPNSFAVAEDDHAEEVMQRMEERGQLQRCRLTYHFAQDRIEGSEEMIKRFAQTEPLQLEAREVAEE
jgi:hypothetical protein